MLGWVVGCQFVLVGLSAFGQVVLVDGCGKQQIPPLPLRFAPLAQGSVGMTRLNFGRVSGKILSGEWTGSFLVPNLPALLWLLVGS
jgi:hypothetical protein